MATFATCRGCQRAFTDTGPGRQCPDAPRLCCDCYNRERAFHDHHSPGVQCLMPLILEPVT